jgi:hypothetical protein
MRLLDATSAESYLRDTRRVSADERVWVRELPGGVSNMVLLVERPDRPGHDFVLKQARAQLRTTHVWYSSIERIWREAEVLEICSRLLGRAKPLLSDGGPPARIPTIVFEDRDHYVLAISAAPRPNVVWREELLCGRADERVATACGRLLGTLHAESWFDRDIAAQLGDRTLFEELRIDPYYRTLAAQRPETRGPIEALVASLEAHPRSLVHADFSPKNLLVFSGGLMMVDFETGHFGDPAFDLGFFLSHLVLKACHRIPHHAPYLELTEAFRQAYERQVGPAISDDELAALWVRGIQNFAGCAWARLDGKSPVDYLRHPARRELVRSICLEIFAAPYRDWPAVVALCRQRFDRAARQAPAPLEGLHP